MTLPIRVINEMVVQVLPLLWTADEMRVNISLKQMLHAMKTCILRLGYFACLLPLGICINIEAYRFLIVYAPSNNKEVKIIQHLLSHCNSIRTIFSFTSQVLHFLCIRTCSLHMNQIVQEEPRNYRLWTYGGWRWQSACIKAPDIYHNVFVWRFELPRDSIADVIAATSVMKLQLDR